jgi:hypothetical protein
MPSKRIPSRKSRPAGPELPKALVDLLDYLWPDGVIQMFQLQESAFWDLHPKLDRKLRGIKEVRVLFERLPEHPIELPDDPEDGEVLLLEEPMRSYYSYFMSPARPEFHYRIDRTPAGHGDIGLVLALSLVAPVAMMRSARREVFEDGTTLDPDITGESGLASVTLPPGSEPAANSLIQSVTRIMDAAEIMVLPPSLLQVPVAWLTADPDLAVEGPVTVRDAFFFAERSV